MQVYTIHLGGSSIKLADFLFILISSCLHATPLVCCRGSDRPWNRLHWPSLPALQVRDPQIKTRGRRRLCSSCVLRSLVVKPPRLGVRRYSLQACGSRVQLLSRAFAMTDCKAVSFFSSKGVRSVALLPKCHLCTPKMNPQSLVVI